jgi:hypothetical protein
MADRMRGSLLAQRKPLDWWRIDASRVLRIGGRLLFVEHARATHFLGVVHVAHRSLRLSNAKLRRPHQERVAKACGRPCPSWYVGIKTSNES